MLPVYDPKSFASVDLRKYHIRTIQDLIKFNEFVSSRMTEAQHILKKFNTQFVTMRGVTEQMQKKAEETQKSYGAPAQATEETPEIQSVEKQDTAEQRNAELLAEIKQAAANETLVPEEDEDPNDRVQVELEKYKLTVGKHRNFFYRNDGNGFKLVSDKDVPDDIRETLCQLAGVDKAEESK